ncbi:MAG: glycoside hydrolase family 3 C-terminal domain-containing protein [Treponema sp.]|jgi:beta-glucosidase|nr:glycoside hydrolase family 3 C-terminal domain-containing protein [Treponema sp.]
MNDNLCFTAAMEIYRDKNAPVDERVDDLYGRMTLRERIRQLDMFKGPDLLEEKSGGGEIELAGIAAVGGDGSARKSSAGKNIDPKKFASIVGGDGLGWLHDLYPHPDIANATQKYIIEHSRLGIPAIIVEEALRGYCKPGSTAFPSQSALASTFLPELAYKTGRVIGTEARSTGVHGVLAPSMDLTIDPRWGRVEESYGEDTFLASEMAKEMVRGMQGGGINRPDTVMAEPKHFTAHGASMGGLNGGPAMIYGRRALYNQVLPVFEAAVKDAGAYNIMCSYNSIDGIPCANNEELLTDVLRGLWGLRGIVITDMCASENTISIHRTAGNYEQAIADSWNAGVDVQFYDYPHDAFIAAMEADLQSGLLKKSAFERAVKTVLKLKFLLGLFENPYVDESIFPRVFNCAGHMDVSQKVSEASLVLLKNNGILPLQKNASIAVVGYCAQNPYLGAYGPRPAFIVNSIQAISELTGCPVPYVDGVYPLEKDIDPAIVEEKWKKGLDTAAKASIVVAVLGDTLQTCSEARDRCRLELPGRQREFLMELKKNGKPVVLVLQSGRPVALQWEAENIDAIINQFCPGPFGGIALAKALYGEINPAARLPVSFPRTSSNIPCVYNPLPGAPKGYIDEPQGPLYPFGHGLGYTAFEYADLNCRLEETGLSCSLTIKNTDRHDGEEVVQLYVKDMISSVTSPEKNLKAFARIPLKSGESHRLSLFIPYRSLSLIDRQFRRVAEKGEFLLMAGASSADIRLSKSFTLKEDHYF